MLNIATVTEIEANIQMEIIINSFWQIGIVQLKTNKNIFSWNLNGMLNGEVAWWRMTSKCIYVDSMKALRAKDQIHKWDKMLTQKFVMSTNLPILPGAMETRKTVKKLMLIIIMCLSF